MTPPAERRGTKTRARSRAGAANQHPDDPDEKSPEQPHAPHPPHPHNTKNLIEVAPVSGALECGGTQTE